MFLGNERGAAPRKEPRMGEPKLTTVAERIRALREMKVPELLAEYEKSFGEKPRSKNREHLWRKIAWKQQADAEGGGLSDRAKARIAEIASEVDAALAKRGANLPSAKRGAEGTKAARTETVPFPRVRREGLPLPGTTLTREYKGKEVRVKVLESGVEHEGAVFHSLSALANAITGSHVSGIAFFKLNAPKKGSIEKGRKAK